MPWFKVDDKLHDHRKARSAPRHAMGVWVLAGSWCADNLTDGFVPEGVLSRWGSPDDAAALVTAGLWRRDEDGGEVGWRFHDWGVHNPDAASVRAARAAESEGGQRGNHARWHVGRGVRVPDCPFCDTASGTRSGSDRVPRVAPDSPRTRLAPESSRPVPTRPETSGPRKRATQLPTDWHPNDNHTTLARELGINGPAELVKFRDHHTAKGSTFKDWDAAFRNWLRKTRDFTRGGPASDGPTPIPPRFVPPTPQRTQPDSAGKARDALRQAKDTPREDTDHA